MKIAISTDHRGAPLYDQLVDGIRKLGHELVDVPTCRANSCDYPDMAYGVARSVAEGRAERGILICGTGIGMCISANKVRGIRAAQCYDAFTAKRARLHNDAQICCLAAEAGKVRVASILETFLTTEFGGGRHIARVEKIKRIEEEQCKGD